MKASQQHIRTDLKSLLEAAADLATRLGGTSDEAAQRASGRLSASVIRPLRQAAGARPGDGEPASRCGADGTARAAPSGEGLSVSPPDAVWQLARAVTELRSQSPEVAELAEAAAALQDLAIGLADEASAAGRLAELAVLQGGLGPGIQAMTDGPYLVTGARSVLDWLGRPLRVRPQLALCRCGGSKMKPLYDGTHATVGFTGRQRPGPGPRPPRHLPRSAGDHLRQPRHLPALRVLHRPAGECVPLRRGTVRHPQRGRMDEIIRAVRDCPSGALSYGIDNAEARGEVDWHGKREPVIEVTRDGPYPVTGAIALTDGQGNDEPRNAGASREHYALCRCGHSQNKPFCSGMHWYVEFKDPVPDPDREPTIFEWAGGLPALTRMTRIFAAAVIVIGPFVSDGGTAAPRLAPPPRCHGCALPVLHLRATT